MAVADIKDLKKVVFAKSSKGGDEKGSPNQDVPPDVEIETIPSGDEEGDEEKKEKEGEGDNKEGKEKDGGEKSKGNGEGEKKEGTEKEGEGDGEGDGEGQGDGEKGEGKGKGSGESKEGGSGEGDPSTMSREQIEKKAQELLDKLKSYDQKASACGSSNERDNKKGNTGESDLVRAQKEQLIREQILQAIDEANAAGAEHPLRQSGSSRGEGKGSGGPQGTIITIPMKKPEFLKRLREFAKKEFEKKYYKKGTDWMYSQAYNDIFFKDRPKVAFPKKAVFIVVDVSGSMFGDFDGTGKSLIEHLIGYLPTIAGEGFAGEVWWASDGIVHWSDEFITNKKTGKKEPAPAITPVKFFKDKTPFELARFYERVKKASGTGGGTTFSVEFQTIQDLREIEKHMIPIICLTDGYIDTVKTKYTWDGKVITAGLPPNTIMMTDPSGKAYLKEMYNEDFTDKSKRIELYDVTENGKYKSFRQ